jgi:8-oxo-dGTP diphosphatase
MTEDLLRATVTQRGVLFAPNDEILVVQRATDGGWELPGGRVDRHEDAVEGLCREIGEETGLSPAVGTPIHTLVWRNDAGEGRFAVYYYCRASNRNVSLSAEHDAFEWRPPGTLQGRLSDPQQTAVELATREHEPVDS